MAMLIHSEIYLLPFLPERCNNEHKKEEWRKEYTHSVPHSFSWTQHFSILVSLLSAGHRCISKRWKQTNAIKKIANILYCICWTVETKLNVKIELHSHLLCITMAIIYFCFSIWFELTRRSVYKKDKQKTRTNNDKSLLIPYFSTHCR